MTTVPWQRRLLWRCCLYVLSTPPNPCWTCASFSSFLASWRLLPFVFCYFPFFFFCVLWKITPLSCQSEVAFGFGSSPLWGAPCSCHRSPCCLLLCIHKFICVPSATTFHSHSQSQSQSPTRYPLPLPQPVVVNVNCLANAINSWPTHRGKWSQGDAERKLMRPSAILQLNPIRLQFN